MKRASSRRVRALNAPRSGGVLALSLMVAVGVAMLTACFLQLSGAMQRRQIAAVDTRRAFYLAEAGLAEAYSGLKIGKSGAVGSAEQPAGYGWGMFWVEAEELDEHRLTLQSTGLCGVGRAVLSQVVERGEQSIATLGVFAAEDLTIPVGSRVDGYDSEEGEPGPSSGDPPAGQGGEVATWSAGRIGSNADIEIDGSLRRPTVVQADLAPGPDGEVRLGRGVSHIGSQAPRSSAVDLPPVTPPFEPDQPGKTQSGSFPLTLQPGEHGLEYLRVAPRAQVILRGPCTLVTRELRVEARGTLELDTRQGPVAIYVDGDLDLAKRSKLLTAASDPSQASIQVVGPGPVGLDASARFRGVIYAPQATIEVGQSFELYGALVGQALDLAPGASLHFDRHLDELGAEAALPTLLAWRIVDLKPLGGARAGQDAFRLLGIDPATLPTPEKAHADQWLDLQYIDKLGVTRSYSGMESGFDWSNVQSVLALDRDGVQVVPGGQAPPPPPPASTAALDAIHQVPALGSSALRDALISASPLSSAEIMAAIDRVPVMNDSHLRDVLEQNSPLGQAELDALLNRPAGMSSSDLKDVLIASSPLPGGIVSALLSGLGNLGLSDLLAVLGAQ